MPVTSTAWVAWLVAATRTVLHRVRLEAQVGEDPPVACVARGVERGVAEVAVVRRVQPPGRPLVAVVEQQQRVRPVPSDRPRDVAAQAGPSARSARRDGRGTRPCRRPRPRRWPAARPRAAAAHVGGDAVDPGLAAAGEHVDHVVAGLRPGSDRCGGAVLEVVGVGHDGQDAADLDLEREQCGGVSHGAESAAPRSRVEWHPTGVRWSGHELCRGPVPPRDR